MFNKVITLIVVVATSLTTSAIWADDSYIFALLDKNRTEHTLLKIPKSSVEKFSGWKYQRTGSKSISVWYPSMKDRLSYNLWTSTAKEIATAKIKPEDNERKLSIKIGARIISPETTLDTSKIPSFCDRETSVAYKYLEDGSRGDFRRYIQSSPGSVSLNILYLPLKPIKGIYCMRCVENANCRVYGGTDSKISYQAFYEEERIPKETLDIHQTIGKYLDSKIVK